MSDPQLWQHITADLPAEVVDDARGDRVADQISEMFTAAQLADRLRQLDAEGYELDLLAHELVDDLARKVQGAPCGCGSAAATANAVPA